MFMGLLIGGLSKQKSGRERRLTKVGRGGRDILVRFHPVDSIRVSGCVGPANVGGGRLYGGR
jgi:hypothetical protein